MAFTDWIADEQLDEVEIEEDVTSEEVSEVEEAIEEERFEFLFVYSAVAILALHDEVGKSKTDNP